MLDIVIHINGAMFGEGATPLLSSFPPVKGRIELATDLWIGRLEGKLANTILDTCEPAVVGTLKPARQFSQFYA